MAAPIRASENRPKAGKLRVGAVVLDQLGGRADRTANQPLSPKSSAKPEPSVNQCVRPSGGMASQC